MKIQRITTIMMIITLVCSILNIILTLLKIGLL